MRLLLVMVLAVAACKRDDLCAKAVHRVIADLATMSELAPPAADEQRAIDAIESMTTSKCRGEGLSQAQFDCIMAAHPPDWDDQLRACQAFAAKPPSWVVLRPPRDERARIAQLTATPDGPRESPAHYRQLIGLRGATCGLAPDGSVACWGQPLKLGFPAGTYTQLAASSDMACGLDRDGHLHCAVADPQITDRAPTDALTSVAVDAFRGCGIRKADQSLVCWNDLDDPPWSLPTGAFTQVALTHQGGCALRADHTLACFGDETAPPGAYVAVASGCALTTDGAIRCWPASKHDRPLPAAVTQFSCSHPICCGIAADHHIVCNTGWLGPPPAGTFDSVTVMGNHACAVRTNGGTICWGENDDGACNVR